VRLVSELTPAPRERALKRVGHKGADHIAPGNTLASFDAALAEGVDMVEFDVLPERPPLRKGARGEGRLILAHDYADARSRTPLTLEEGLAHFAQDAWSGVELDVDLKLAGYEEEVIDALRRHGLAGRALISTNEERSLPVVRAAAPEIRLGWSVPRLRRNPLEHPVTRLPALALLAWARRVLPARAARKLRAGEIDALMCHWALVTRRLARVVDLAGGELFVWTVDDPLRIAALERLGVAGVITNDPRLFATT
jgi:glycerophosphoryl diester phosphodiesterase